MISSQAQRTLVKSPPELWAELSDPAGLARHLGELGEIRIVRSEPETIVEWAAENTTGTVSIKPSGWGTDVKLTVTREIVLPAPTATAAETAAQEPPAAEEVDPIAPEQRGLPTAREHEPKAAAASPDVARDEPVATCAVEPVAVEPTNARRGFFARLFGRRRAPVGAGTRQQDTQDTPEPADPFAAVREVLAPESFVASHPFAALPPAPADAPQALVASPQAPVGSPPGNVDAPPTADIAAELVAAEEVAEAEVTALLTAVLDHLGAAHHRPFSRA